MAFSIKGTHNRLQVVGRLGQDPVLRYTQSGKAVLNISVATNEKSGQDEVTSWHRAVLWEKKAEVVAKYCHKGSKIMIEGPLLYREWTDKEGIKRVSAEIDVENFLLLDSKEEGSGGDRQGGGDSQQRAASKGKAASDDIPYDDDEDIPF